MPDDTYVLDLQVTGAEQVLVHDDGLGVDAITVQGIYSKTVEISLCWTVLGGQTTTAGALYYGAGDLGHRLVVQGLIENAAGSNGCDIIHGNEFANRLLGDNATTGAGAGDTLTAGLGDDTVYGGAGADLISGDDDDDQLFGDVGSDTIIGGAGIDTVEGGAGADHLSGGGSYGDAVAYLGSTIGVRVEVTSAMATVANGGDAQGDVLDGFLDVIGSDYADRISDADAGTSDANSFFGNGGRDRLALGEGNDRGYGGNSSDLVLGGAGEDALFGGSGKDRIVGGMGQDTLSGGLDADRFIFKQAAETAADLTHADMVTDFLQGDLLDLKSIDADTGTRGNQAFQLISGGFSGAAGEVRLQAEGNDLLVLGDVDGDGQADFAVLLTGISTLTLDDLAL